MKRSISIALGLWSVVCGASAQSLILTSAASGCRGTNAQSIEVEQDPILGKSWNRVRDCEHPERPAKLQEITVEDALVKKAGEHLVELLPTPVLVRAGEVVRLWERSESVRMELSGVAEQPGAEGDQVVVRVTRSNSDGLVTQRIAGVVRGVHDVEMKP